MALDYFPWWVDRRPVAALALYNGSYGGEDPSPWGLKPQWRDGGVSWLISELGRLHDRVGYERFMLSLPAGRPQPPPGEKVPWPSAQWRVLDDAGIRSRRSVRAELADRDSGLTAWLAGRPRAQVLVYLGFTILRSDSRDMAGSHAPDLANAEDRRIVRENTAGWLALTPDRARPQIGFGFDHSGPWPEAFLRFAESFLRRGIFVTGEAIPPEAEPAEAASFAAPWFGLMQFHQARNPALDWELDESQIARTHLGFGVHKRECRSRRDREGRCPGEAWMDAAEIEAALRSAHRRGFVIFCYGRSHDSFVVDLTRSPDPAPGPLRVIWRNVGRPVLPSGDGSKSPWRLAAGFDGALYALDRRRRLWSHPEWGFDDSRWRSVRDLPPGTVDIACAGGRLYFLAEDRSLGFLTADGDLETAGRPLRAADLAGTESPDLAPHLWSLEEDHSLWTSTAGGLDGSWRRVGLPERATRVAASRDLVFTRRWDRSFWVNRELGRDGGWEPAGFVDGLSAITAASDRDTGATRLLARSADGALCWGTLVSGCEVSLAVQNQYPEEVWPSLDLAPTGVATDVVSLSGSWVAAPNTLSVEDFAATDEAEIEERLERYLARHSIRPGTLLILDIEGHCHPKKFGELADRPDFAEIIGGFHKRIAVVRSRLPEVKVGLYGVVVPDATVRDSNAVGRRIRGYRLAAEHQLYEVVDSVCPVLYLHWGPSDPEFSTTLPFLRFGIEQTVALTSTPLAPLLLLKFRHRRSRHYGQILPDPVANAVLAYLRAYPAVERIVYWAKSTDTRNPALYVEPEEIRSFFDRLDPCGRPEDSR